MKRHEFEFINIVECHTDPRLHFHSFEYKNIIITETLTVTVGINRKQRSRFLKP